MQRHRFNIILHVDFAIHRDKRQVFPPPGYTHAITDVALWLPVTEQILPVN